MKKSHPDKCGCPYCDSELKGDCMEPDFCTPCAPEKVRCAKCGQEYHRTMEQCPKCGERAHKKK